MISRTLKEVNYATNERELLAIVWALAKLRHYLYSVKDINIFTDHQPLTFAVSESNPIEKIKRWKALIDESGAKIFYKPGKDNLVADALSRQQLIVVEEEEAYSYAATIYSEMSLTHTIEEFAFVTHSANLSEYRGVVEETNGMTSMFPQSHMQKLLSVDVAHMRDLLESLSIHHRVARSLDFLGTALNLMSSS